MRLGDAAAEQLAEPHGGEAVALVLRHAFGQHEPQQAGIVVGRAEVEVGLDADQTPHVGEDGGQHRVLVALMQEQALRGARQQVELAVPLEQRLRGAGGPRHRSVAARAHVPLPRPTALRERGLAQQTDRCNRNGAA